MRSKFNFLREINKLKLVKRGVNISPNVPENSAEHSWSVAMMCWVLAPELEKEFKQKLDVDKMIRMALIHDIVEIEVGDVPIWKRKLRQNKSVKEEKAAKKLFSPEFLALWHEFEGLKTLEAKTVRAMDKLSAIIQRIDSGQGWHDINGTISKLEPLVINQLSFSKVIMKYFEDLKKEALRKKMIKK